jgi:WS/DGAT/MGAT family acyltransferase
MERLSSLDGVFLAAEDPEHPMNIGSVAIFAGSAPPLDEVTALLAERIPAVPRCRQRLREPTGPIGRPVWIDDPWFDVTRHVHSASIPGGEPGALESFTAGVVAAPLDRTRPLWEVWVVDNADDDRWALLAKIHHCLVDGIAGSDLLGALLAPGAPTGLAATEPWQPAPAPSPAEFTWFGVRSALRTLAERVYAAIRVLRRPAQSGRRAWVTLGAAKHLWFRQRRVDTSLTGPIGSRRRWARTTVDPGTIAEIRSGLGGTVNDIVVVAVALGLRDLLIARGEPVAGRTVTAMVPVSVRTPAERGRTGNRVANVHAVLPMDLADPPSLLRAVHEHLEDLKHSHEVEATGLLLRIGDFVPRIVADRVVRTILRHQRSVETVITDVPGPTARLALGPHRMIGGFPVAPIAGRVRICIAVWSYVDTLAIGITGDFESVPDIDLLAEGIRRGFSRLRSASRPA